MQTVVNLLETFECRVALGLTWLWGLGVAVDLLLKRHSAAARRDLWLSISVAAACVPLIVAVAPTWSLGLARDSVSAAPGFSSASAPIEVASRTSSSGETPIGRKSPSTLPENESAESEPVVAAPQGDLTIPFRPTHAAPSIATLAARIASIPTRMILLTAWLSGVSISLLLFVRDSLATKRVLRAAKPIMSDELQAVARAVASQLGLKNPPRILESDAPCVPACIGILRTRVLLPPNWRDWNKETLRGVLAHEFAHILRLDLPIQAFSLLLGAFLWLHPISWWANWRMRVERERTADDLARGVSNRPSDFALALLEAAQAKPRRALSLAVSMSGATPLENRVRRILDDRIPRERPSLRFQFCLLAVLAAAAMGGSTLTPFVRSSTAQDRPAETTANVLQDAALGKAPLRFDEVEVAGKVINVDGTPAEGVEVLSRVADQRAAIAKFRIISVRTNQDGKFAFAVHRDQLAHLQLLAVAKDSRFQRFLKSPFSDAPSREYWKEIVLELEEAKAVVATVLDPDGKPAKGAELWLEYEYPAPQRDSELTDERGQVQLWIPNGLVPNSAIASLDEIGVDYTTFRQAENIASPRTAPAVIPDAFELKLVRNVEISVNVVDEMGNPLSRATVYSSFRRPGRREFLVRGDHLPKYLQWMTNEKGEARVFAPSDVNEPVSVSASLANFTPVERMGRRYSGMNNNDPTGFLWNPAKPEPVKIVMRDTRAFQTMLRGRVVDAKGNPLANASVAASGQGFQRPMPFHKNSTYTDAKGEFSLSVAKNMFYSLFIETGDHLAAQRSFTIADSAPREPVVIPLAPARAVTIRAIDATTAKPAPDCPIQVSLTTLSEYQRRYVAGDETPKIHTDSLSGGRLAPSTYVFRGVTDESGEVKLFLPEGQYQAVSFTSGQMNDERQFQVRDQDMEVEILAYAAGLVPGAMLIRADVKLPKIPFKGTITDERGNLLAGATVWLQSRIPLARVGTEKTATDAEGQFEFDRDPRATLLQVVSLDKTMSAVVNIPTNAQEWTLKLTPAPRVIGQLIDAKTKKPIVGKNVQAQRRGGNGWSDGQIWAKSTTDDQGRFILTPLIPGIHYSIDITEGDIRDLSTYRSASWASVFLENAGQAFDLREMHISDDE